MGASPPAEGEFVTGATDRTTRPHDAGHAVIVDEFRAFEAARPQG